jgi:RNA polymerase-interacting CarD/CdnL/TRCF family regulator
LIVECRNEGATMGFFSGPSKYVTLRIAQGVASYAGQIQLLRNLSDADRTVILEGMRSESAPTTMDELISSAASVIAEYKMGYWKKAQFLGMLRVSMIGNGISQADAAYLTGMIELDKGIRRHLYRRAGQESSSRESAPAPVKTESSIQEKAKLSTEAPRIEEPRHNPAQRYGFHVNEFIVYPQHGVGQIVAIEEQEIAGARLELFVINFMKDKMTLRVPTKKVTAIGMRKLSNPAEVQRAFVVLSQRSHVASGQWSRLAQEYEAKINSGDIVAISEVVRDLYRPAVNPGQTYSERQLYEAALDRLSREIAVVHRVAECEVVKEIEALLIARPPYRHDESPAK